MHRVVVILRHHEQLPQQVSQLQQAVAELVRPIRQQQGRWAIVQPLWLPTVSPIDVPAQPELAYSLAVLWGLQINDTPITAGTLEKFTELNRPRCDQWLNELASMGWLRRLPDPHTELAAGQLYDTSHYGLRSVYFVPTTKGKHVLDQYVSKLLNCARVAIDVYHHDHRREIALSRELNKNLRPYLGQIGTSLVLPDSSFVGGFSTAVRLLLMAFWGSMQTTDAASLSAQTGMSLIDTEHTLAFLVNHDLVTANRRSRLVEYQLTRRGQSRAESVTAQIIGGSEIGRTCVPSPQGPRYHASQQDPAIWGILSRVGSFTIDEIAMITGTDPNSVYRMGQRLLEWRWIMPAGVRPKPVKRHGGRGARLFRLNPRAVPLMLTHLGHWINQ